MPYPGRALLLGALGLLAAACAPVVASAPPEPVAVAPPATRGSTFPKLSSPTSFTAVAPPAGATSTGGTHEWYRAPAPGGRAVVLGVYRPTTPSATPPIAALVLHGNDGFRRQYEALAARLAGKGMIAIVGCWFDRPEQLLSDAPDAVSCSGGPKFKGAQLGIPALDALVDAASQVADVAVGRLVLFGHSYGATVALDRASTGEVQPVVSSAGLLARAPEGVAPPAPGDVLPSDPGKFRTITVPVMLAHGDDDPIVPVGQAKTFEQLLKALGRPPTVHYYPAPAGHSFPFTGPYVNRFVNDATTWIGTLTFP